MKRTVLTMLACLVCLPGFAQTAKPTAKTQTAKQPQPPTAVRVIKDDNSLTNDQIIKMATAGLSDEIIIGVIDKTEKENRKFDTSPNGLIRLKSSHVSDRVISSMMGIQPQKAETKPIPPAGVAETHKTAQPEAAAPTSAPAETTKAEDPDKGPIDRLKGLFHKKGSEDAEVASPAPKATFKPSSDVKEQTKRKQAYEFPLSRSQSQAYEQLKKYMQTQVPGMKLDKADSELGQLVGIKLDEAWTKDHKYTTTVLVMENKVKVVVTNKTIGNHFDPGVSTADKFDLDNTIKNGQLLESVLR